MRERLFRGKKKADGTWVTGFYWNDGIKFHYIRTVEVVAQPERKNEYSIIKDFNVYPETVGEYTGLTDKNVRTIFDGDIVRILYTDWVSKSENDHRTLEEYLRDIANIGVVKQDKYGTWSVLINNYFYSLNYGRYGYVEVIGNIHDNPELLEEKK